jgi:hypothetical protein
MHEITVADQIRHMLYFCATIHCIVSMMKWIHTNIDPILKKKFWECHLPVCVRASKTHAEAEVTVGQTVSQSVCRLEGFCLYANVYFYSSKNGGL